MIKNGIGSLRQIVEIFSQKVSPGDAGQVVKVFTLDAKMRGDWRQINGKEFILSGAQLTDRQGTLLTRFYRNADECLFIRINKKDVYEVTTFNHNNREESTLWTLKMLNSKDKPELPE